MDPVRIISLQEAAIEKLIIQKLIYIFQSNENRAFWVKSHQPYRSSYYAFYLCIRGKATFRVNLKDFEIRKGSLIVVKDDDIKQWVYRSKNYEAHTVFFEKEAIIAVVRNQVFELDFSFFNESIVVVDLSSKKMTEFKDQLIHFAKLYTTPGKFRSQKLAHYLSILLYTTAEYLPSQKKSANISRSKEITNAFIKLASKNVINHRNLDYYSHQLGLSKKHLSKTIKKELNKTASQVLGDYLLLEAKVRLKETTATIEEIAHYLNFNDPSAFNKFFKRHTGLTAKKYRE